MLAPALVSEIVGLVAVMFTGVESVEFPELSHALAVNECRPAGGLVQTKLYGLTSFSPSFTLSAKNSTFTTDPSPSEALAARARFPGTMKTAPELGELNEMLGGWFETLADPGDRPAAN